MDWNDRIDANDTTRWDSNGVLWRPAEVTAENICSHCGEVINPGPVLVSEDLEDILHVGCWKLHEGYIRAEQGE